MALSEEVIARFKGLDDISFQKEDRIDWNDRMLCGKKGVRVYTMTNTEIVELGSRVLKDVMQSVTEETVGAIILLAWNLRNPADLTQSVFPNHSPCASSEDIEYYALSTATCSNSSPRIRGTLTFPVSVSESAASICYICASLLRLFTKPVNSYFSALPYIISSFSGFYRFRFPLAWYSPAKDSLEAIKFRFNAANPIFKYGMAGMLYLHNEIPTALELRNVLYEKHLSFTGMHAYTLFVGVQKALEVTVEDIGKFFRRCIVAHSFMSLANVIRDFDGDTIPENRKRMTWKYARVFDSSFFTGIQTKECCYLVYLLAYLSILIGVQDESVMKIAQLAYVGESVKEILQHDAQAIYNAFSAGKAATVSTSGDK